MTQPVEDAPRPLLEVADVAVLFGGMAALDGVSISIPDRSIVGLIGPNGAGKTTLFNVISGVIRPTAGSVAFRGSDITGLPIHRITRLGLVRTFQLTRLFDELTVLENVLIGCHITARPSLRAALVRTRATRAAEKAKRERAHELLEITGIEKLAGELCASLSHGHRKLLNVAVSLGADPACLLLDEPVSGMNEEEVNRTLDLIRTLRKERGKTILIVEHNVKAIVSLCDKAIVLDFGRKIAEGPPQEVVEDEAVQRAYLGDAESMPALALEGGG